MVRIVVCVAALFRDSLTQVLAARGHDAVACCADPVALVAALARRPDVVLVDDQRSTEVVVTELQRSTSPTRVVLLSDAPASPPRWPEGLAVDVVRSSSDLAGLERALVDTASRGGVQQARPRPHLDRRDRPPLSRLTPREREVIELVADGRSTQRIADMLGITPKTVYTHVEAVLHKLDATNRLQAVSTYLARRDGARSLTGSSRGEPMRRSA